MLKDYDYQMSANITSTIEAYTSNYDLDYRHPQGVLFNNVAYFDGVTNKQVDGAVWYSDSDGEVFSCGDYADIAFLKAMYLYKTGKFTDARTCYDTGASMFDGIGMRDSAFNGDGQRYSTYKRALANCIECNRLSYSVRTAAFLTLETMLGYGSTNDATSKTYADKAASALLNPQVKSNGVVTRENEDGSFTSLTRPLLRGGVYTAWNGFNYVTKNSILQQMSDAFNQPDETLDIKPSNAESTITVAQALRVYDCYNYGTSNNCVNVP